MATRQERDLATSRESALNALQSSGTAQFGSVPTTGDVAAQQRLLKTQAQIDSIKDAELKKRWYKENQDRDVAVENASRGAIGKFLDTISRPLYGVAGVADYALGNTSAGSLGEAVTANMKTSKRTFGDVLRSEGVPKFISAPLGFMLDLTFDPVNWATMGTGALVPRVVAGGVKGATKGGIKAGLTAAAKGAESRVLENVMTARSIGQTARNLTNKLRPGAGKAITEVEEQTGRFGNIMKKLEERSVASKQAYDDITGLDVLGNINKGVKIPGVESEFRMSLGNLLRESINSEATPAWMKRYFKYFDYNNAEWTRLVKIKDAIMKSGTIAGRSEDEVMESMRMFKDKYKPGMSVNDVIEEVATDPERLAARAAAAAEVPATPTLFDDTGGGAAARVADEAVDIINNPSKYTSTDPLENGIRLAQDSGLVRGTSDDAAELVEDIKDIIGRGELGDTGVAWYDNAINSLRNWEKSYTVGNKKVEVGKMAGKVLDTYDKFTALFKRAKVGASLTAWTNSVIGNPTMAWMAGINIFDPKYMESLSNARKIVYQGSGYQILLARLMANDEMVRALADNPTLFTRTTGLESDIFRMMGSRATDDMTQAALLPKLKEAKRLLEEIKTSGRDIGAISKMESEDLSKLLADAMDEIKIKLGLLEESRTANIAKQVAEGRKIKQSDLPTSLVGSEFMDSSAATEMFNFIKEKADAGDMKFKVLDAVFNNMSKKYEGIDQTFKFGNFIYATKHGLTENELRVIGRNIDVSPDDFTKTVDSGVTRYKMSPEKALELSNEVYLNYNAMPAAVRVFRSIPVLSSPFISFTYGMGLKTVKTAMTNPAVFNKVSFAQQEFGGDKSPIERAVLGDPRYAYMNDPSMVKILGGSFFDTNSLYLNMANMIPYYSLNMFTPTERRYENVYADNIIGAIDKAGLFTHPVGSTIFDMFIQPLILKSVGSEETVLGPFGQPIAPLDANMAERALYGSRNLADAVMPGVLQYPTALAYGAASSGGLIPQNIPFTDTPTTNLLPGYGTRKMVNAASGKTAIGTQTKEQPFQKLSRAVAGTVGVPVTPLPLTYLPKNLEETLRKLNNNNQ